MKNLKCLVSASAMTLTMFLSSPAVSAMDYGYCEEKPAGYIAGNYDVMNYAVMVIPENIAAQYKGAEIKSVMMYVQPFSTVNTADAFVAESLEDFSPVTLQTGDVEGDKWSRIAFDTPYVITGDKDIFVGYAMRSGSTQSAMPVGVGASGAIEYGDIIGSVNSSTGLITWEHAGDAGYGNLLIKAEIAGDNLPEKGVVVISARTPLLAVPGKDFEVTGTLFNYGSAAVTGYTLLCESDGREVASEEVTGEIASCGLADFTLGGISFDEVKEQMASLSVKVDGVKGAEYQFAVEVTDKTVPRKVLIEEFTTAQCSNCPRVHRLLEAFSEERDDLIMVAHHSGYGSDVFTTSADNDYLWFYQGDSYAPALMIDRTNFAEFGAVSQVGMSLSPSPGPVMAVNADSDLKKYVDLAASAYSFVNIDIDYTYDADTRKLDVTVSGTPTKVFDSWSNPVVNIYLVEKSAIGAQAGGNYPYTHRHIFRKAMTGTWGEAVTLEVDKPFSCTSSATLKDSWDAGNMDIVAFVSNFNSRNANDCEVLNAAAVEIDTPSTGLDRVESGTVTVEAVTGGVAVAGCFVDAVVFDAGGVCHGTLDTAGSIALPSGVYIVKVTTDETVVTEKISVK